MSKYTETIFDSEAREALKRGAEKVYEAVSRTLGAAGRNAVYETSYAPTITNDGVSISRVIEPKDAFEKLGSDLIKQSSEKTNEEAGDGTSTSIVLARELIQAAWNEDGIAMRERLEADKKVVVEEVKKLAKPVESEEDIHRVALVSSESSEIAKIVSDSVKLAGEYGDILVEESVGYKIDMKREEGYSWDSGYVSPYMITDIQTQSAVLEDCAVLVTDRSLSLVRDGLQALADAQKHGARSILIVAESVSGDFLASLIATRARGGMLVVAVRRPRGNEELEDIAALVNANAVTKEKGIKDIRHDYMGFAKKVVVTKDKTIVLGERSEVVEQRISSVKKEIDEKKDVLEDGDTKQARLSRLAKLSDGVVTIKVGAKTEGERKYLKLKVDDAVCACRAAREEGVVEGGGYALYTIANDPRLHPITQEALRKPYEMILKNAGIGAMGTRVNVKTKEEVSDFFVEGIIDPAKVVRCSVENAVSFAGMLLTISSATVYYDRESKETVV